MAQYRSSGYFQALSSLSFDISQYSDNAKYFLILSSIIQYFPVLTNIVPCGKNLQNSTICMKFKEGFLILLGIVGYFEKTCNI